MSISLKTMKMLWGRAANRCAFPSCPLDELVIDSNETDDEALVGDACHMVAEKEDGPRGISPLTREQRDLYSNLILLCKVHHKTIDDQYNTYTVEVLQKMKKDHEQWVRNSLKIDLEKQRDDENYASIIEDWSRYADIDNWEDWTWSLVSAGQPSLSKKRHSTLYDLNRWLLSRIWPRRYPDLEDAFQNFRRVLDDLLSRFDKYVDWDSRQTETLWTEKIYKRAYSSPHRDYDPAWEEQLTEEYQYHVNLVEDLTLELTRAANYVCDKVRQYILPTFGLNKGALLIILEEGFASKRFRVEYRGEERTSMPYPGLERFKHERSKRDIYYGEGDSPQNEEDI